MQIDEWRGCLRAYTAALDLFHEFQIPLYDNPTRAQIIGFNERIVLYALVEETA
jgi:hypothetical protein